MRDFKQIILGVVLGVSLAPGVYAEGRLFTPGFDLTTDAKFEHRYFYPDDGDARTFKEKKIIKVDPRECVKFGRGLQNSLTVKINGRYATAYRNDDDLSELVHTNTCELALLVGQSLDPLMNPESESEKGSPVYIENIPTTRIGMRVRPAKNMDMKGERLMYVHYEEKGIAKTLYFPLPACVNPDTEGEIVMDDGPHQVRESLSSVNETPKLNLLLAKACIAMAAPYSFVNDNSKLYQPAKRIVNNVHTKLYPQDASITKPVKNKYYSLQ